MCLLLVYHGINVNINDHLRQVLFTFFDGIAYYEGMGKYTFGPVPSRRLGFSLGVDIIPFKYCSFDCVYCQIGKTTRLEIERKSFFDPEEIVDEVVRVVKGGGRVDYITFSGSGEPTLNKDLGSIIRKVKGRVETPVAVITNGSLLYREDVRRDLMAADVVLPSLDAASEEIFRKINRPHPSIDLDTVIAGLKAFRAGYKGSVWLEIMLMKDINDSPEELGRFKGIIADLAAEKIQLNTVTRPPCEELEGTMGKEALEKVRAFLGAETEIICDFHEAVGDDRQSETWEERVLEILERRSMSIDDMVKITGVSSATLRNRLNVLEREGVLKSYAVGDILYFLKPQSEGQES